MSDSTMQQAPSRPAPHAASGACISIQAVIDSLADSVALINQRGEILCTNQRWQQFAAQNGADDATRNGAGLNYLDVCRRGGVKEIADGIAAVLAGELPGFTFEYPCHSVSSKRWFRLSATPLQGADGCALLSHVDITEHKQLNAELERHRDHLEAMVAERTQQLDEANRALRKLAQTRSDFLANMSHEIRTPLNAVLGFAQTGVRDNAGRKAQINFRRILDSGQHLLGIINDILDFSKIEAGKLLIEEIPFRLVDVIDRATTLTTEWAREKKLDFQVSLGPDLPEVVTGDPQRLGQILLNLLSNSIKFTDTGKVSLSVSCDGDQGIFRVTDSGIGMTQEQIGRLFAAFEQADSSTTRRFGGTGLGLAISQRLTMTMGGSLTAHSQLGSGSTFELRLPLPASQEAPTQTTPDLYAPPATEKRPLPRLNGLRILVAEDTEINRFVLDDMLTPEGASLTFVDNGQKAVNWVGTHGADSLDLILMDIQMPIMDGHEATRRLQQIAPELPVIGLTARALAEERAQSLAAGMVQHLSKPVDGESLVAAILHYALRQPLPLAAEASTSPPTASLIDWEALTQSFSGRQPAINRLLDMAEQGHAETPARIRDTVCNHDHQALASLAHILKGSMGHMQARSVCELAAKTEVAARAGDADCFSLAEMLASEMDALLAQLRRRKTS
jgi:signal transduction histidine kinase/CheY-like chemotaxis protein/HPt (histidine-containing phosphotransfer) domain-containing protein